MPNLDKTGPSGQGPMTGRGAGNCDGVTSVRGFGRGFGRCCGRGFGFGFRQPTKQDTENYIKGLEAELKEAKESLK